MFNSTDLYLGTFLVLCGFALSLLNLRRIMKSNSQFSSVLLSENIILMCIGIAFVSRSVYEMTPVNIDVMDMERSAVEMTQEKYMSKNCDFSSVLMSYGPFIVSLVNSFLSLIIDNYMHYRMMENMKEKDEENNVQEIGESGRGMQIEVKKLLKFFKKYFSLIAIAMQWIMPIFMVLSMYPIGVKEMMMPKTDLASASDSCVAMLDINNNTCDSVNNSTVLEVRKYIPSSNYLEVYENLNVKNNTEIDSVINNVYKIVANLQNNTKTFSINVTSPYLYRKSKLDARCIKMCYLENRKLILYMFLLAIVSYFIPVTVSTIILTKIHIMDIKKPNMKTYVSRELLYNILFWTPVMFDTFLSLILCSYSMNSMRASLFNVIANIYQAVKNFMNATHFKDNTVVPV